MSEDTAHGQHFEPGTGPFSEFDKKFNAEFGPVAGQQEQAGPVPVDNSREQTIEQALNQQMNRCQALVKRVDILIGTAQEAFRDFVVETAILFRTLESFAKETDANKPANSTTAQA